jgi:hypothetical protein
MSQAVRTHLDEYRDQLSLLAEAMCVTRSQAPTVRVDSQYQLDLFAEENFAKRIDKIKAQVEFVHEAFDNLDALIEECTLDNPMAPYDRNTSDGGAFLDWLARRRKLSKKRQDYVTVARARLRIEEGAGTQRRGHLRFQELYSVAHELLPEFGFNPDLRIHLNPVRTRARLVTSAFLEGETPPVEVLFFPFGHDVRTAILDERGLTLIDELDRFAPCTLHEWSVLSDLADAEELASLVRQFVELGLAALA